MVRKLIRKVYQLFKGKTPSEKKEVIFSIGIFQGSSIQELTPSTNTLNPVIEAGDVTDADALFVADPFVFRFEDKWYMFFEILKRENKKGEIALAISENGLKWKYDKIILAEPFHLSYPFVFGEAGEIYMTPECNATRSVRLYKAKNFPYKWEFVKSLVSGKRYSDPTLFKHKNYWWMFTETNPDSEHSQLSLYYSDHLLGDWTEHSLSPVIDGDPQRARPAGRVISDGNKLIRFAQDCIPRYGTNVRSFDITDLSPETYLETETEYSPLLTGSGTGWNANGMHHIDTVQTDDGTIIAFVDGWNIQKISNG